MRHAPLIFAYLLGSACAPQFPETSNWDPRAATFRWWAGEVDLPHGFTYFPLGGDSDYGELTSSDGKITLWHDIGGYAGIYARQQDAIAFTKTTVDHARVWFAISEHSRPDGAYYLVAVSFPDSGPANFYLYTEDPERDAHIISGIANSFRPASAAGPRC